MQLAAHPCGVGSRMYQLQEENVQRSIKRKLGIIGRAMAARNVSQVPHLVSPGPNPDAPFVLLQEISNALRGSVAIYCVQTDGRNLCMHGSKVLYADYLLDERGRANILLEANLMVSHVNHIYALERGLLKFDRRLFYKKTPEQKREIAKAALRGVVAPKTGGEE